MEEMNIRVISKDGTAATLLKLGMTNVSYLITHKDISYILRLPGAGTERLINRNQEYEVYKALENFQISDEVLFFNSDNGIKITKYWKDARMCNPQNMGEVRKCMQYLNAFHKLHLKVNHTFHIFDKINFYESLLKKKSRYPNYHNTKNAVFLLQKYIESQPREWCLAHIDAVPDNFLFIPGGLQEEIKMIDWEYAGMQDPHIDIAMFALYALYDRQQTDQLIDFYFDGDCDRAVRLKIYCYIAAGGLLWSNWCEYKEDFGISFGSYAQKQYQYAEEYSRICMENIL